MNSNYLLTCLSLSALLLNACVDDDDNTVMAGVEVVAGTEMAGTEAAGTMVAGTMVAGTEVAGTMMAGTEVAGTMVAGTEVAGTMMAGTEVAGTMMAGTEVAGTMMAGSELAGTEVLMGDPCEEQGIDPSVACAVTIYEARNPNRVALGRTVSVEGVVTTVRRGDDGQSHLVLQVSPNAPEYTDPAYSGIWVYLNDATVEFAEVSVGQNLSLSAVVGEYFGQRQLATVSELVDLGAVYPAVNPVIVDAATVATNGVLAEAYEGVLVSVSPVEVIEQNPMPGPGDRDPNNEFVIAGGLRVNDFLTQLTPLPEVGETWNLIVGVLRLGNGDYKLEPRNSIDVGRPVPMGDPSGLRINEIDYSQPGADSGEFIEVVNTGAQIAPLWGVYLELINGTDLSAYEDYHLAEAADSLAPGEFLVVGSADIIMSLNGVASLGLGGAIQNGPDGVRLSHESLGTLDELGYGGLELSEGSTSIADEDDDILVNSLGRCQADSDQNASDFVAMESTPGVANSCN